MMMAVDTSRPRRSLILAGGGMRVAYQAGVIRALADAGIEFDHIDGTSGGIINLAMMLSGLSPEEMVARWQTLNPRDFVSLPSFAELVRAPDVMAWGDADGVRDKIFPHLGINVDTIRAQQGVAGTFNVCNFTRKTVESIPHTDIDLDLLVAGISLPVLMPPVERQGVWYTDAVWIKDANVMEAVRRGADEVWVVWCIGNTPAYERGAFRQYVHMIEMAANGALFEEFSQVREINARIAQGEAIGGRRKPLTLHVIKPDVALPLDPDYYFGRINGKTLTERGYSDAWRYLKVRRPDGIPWTPEATAMRAPKPGITFAETMEGPFALNLPDPKQLDAIPKEERTELAIHVTVHIDDMQRFVGDEQHPGQLTGYIEFPPFGKNIPATKGVFNLFSPTNDPLLTHMVYEVGFQHEGKSYYLAGHKEVRDDPGFDLWADTTTLYTKLYEGENAGGRVIGAGVLRLGMTDLVKLVRSMRAIGTDSVEEQGQVVAQFGKFFLRELWATYGPKPAQSFQPAP